MTPPQPVAGNSKLFASVVEIKLALDQNREKLLRLADYISQDKVTDESAAEELANLTNQRIALLENWDALIVAAKAERKARRDAVVRTIRRIERLSK
ncbi:hypothetical protein [Sphingorhabdus sp.]|uniref:hypothetical protein n=1 Tax=Sphingorhabdus sp. TaxID=1902408 RepID=UPI0039838CA1